MALNSLDYHVDEKRPRSSHDSVTDVVLVQTKLTPLRSDALFEWSPDVVEFGVTSDET